MLVVVDPATMDLIGRLGLVPFLVVQRGAVVPAEGHRMAVRLVQADPHKVLRSRRQLRELPDKL